MSENPDGTPNPLNPTPTDEKAPEAGDTNSSEQLEPTEESLEEEKPETKAEAEPEEKPAEAVEAEKESSKDSAQPMPEPIEAEEKPEPIKVDEAKEQILSSEPELKGSVVEPANKSKKGWLIALIALLAAGLIGGGAAAIVLLNPFGGGNGGGGNNDVNEAFLKLFSQEGRENVALSGDVTVSSSDRSTSYGILSAKMTLDGGVNVKTLEEYATVDVSAKGYDGSSASLTIDQIHTAKGDNFVKFSNIKAETATVTAGEDYYTITDGYDEDDCVTAGDSDSCTDPYVDSPSNTSYSIFTYILSYLDVFKGLEGKWLIMSQSDLSAYSQTTVTTTSQCMADAMKDATKYSEAVKGIYKNNSFVKFTADTTGLTTKGGTLYKMTIDSDKLADFVNALAKDETVSALAECMGATTSASSVSVDKESLSKMLDMLPDFYVEVKDSEITRFLVKAYGISGFDVEADFAISYPEKTVINEPSDYTDFQTAITNAYTIYYTNLMGKYKLNY